MPYILIVFSYLLGSIPFGLLFSKWSGMGDIRNVGSGNIGATNVLRTGNKKIAIATLLCDVLKGAIPIILIHKYYAPASAANWIETFVALAAVLGHVFPVWIRFKGGKGVATALGVYFALNPLLGAFTMLTWLIMAKVFRISSLSALVASTLSPLIAYYLCHWTMTTLVYNTLFIAILILHTHRDNIRRLLSGQESRIEVN
ncbi:MAG: glycerol-3-phosphate 1-O-acyltransferase PlsY [Pseudomonadota bacterium]|nr:glycerol-3-phosphate 1-O-acyltransferase PlsY [Alphaproteobacteria bacterium]MDP5012538.1 glycerol-3-phosphate 1-O-acyltransferase PlsY [Alphaproteobacteria bacterium]MDP5370255.1 glycerol-3-phosphate 1-O-acyltransferase PlsY [Pseudomonadota bacterium]